MRTEEITAALQAYLADKIGKEVDATGHYADLDDLDSFDVLSLVLFAETSYGVKFTARDFESPDFATLSGMAGLIEGRMSEAGPRGDRR